MTSPEDGSESIRPRSAFDSETFGKDISFHLEQPIGSMSISPCGRDVVLASKEGLHIIDLDSPYSPPRYLPHHTSWEVADVQWSPFATRDYWVVSTSNQKALVWNLGMSSVYDSIEYVLHGHTRAITDINFSAHEPDILATCAVDSFVHCWDLRSPLRPAVSFSDWFAGATQVKWNRQDANVVASSHDRYLHIWDKRNGAYPIRSVEAHHTKIYGIDWNRFHPNKLVTCSLDKTIKFWDLDNPKNSPERVLDTTFPVWRARHTPFGWGLLAMPQRGDSDFHLYDSRPVNGKLLSGLIPAVAHFPGHKGQAKEFLWRARGSIADGRDHRDFQLVSWGTDHELRLHHVDEEVFRSVEYEKGISEVHALRFTRKGAAYKTFRDEPSEIMYDDVFESEVGSLPSQGGSANFRARNSSVGMSKMLISQARSWARNGWETSRVDMHGKTWNKQDTNPISWMRNVKMATRDQDSLPEEVTLVGSKFAKVDFGGSDIHRRKVAISLHGPWGIGQAPVYLQINMQFPKHYPRSGTATAKIQKTGSITEELLVRLSTELRTITETYATKQWGCLEATVRYLLGEQDMEQIVNWVLDEPAVDPTTLGSLADLEDNSSSDEEDGAAPFTGPTGLLNSGNLNKNALPVAKACGALWSETGKLVCFFPPDSKKANGLLNSIHSKTDQPRTGRTYEGFGRMQVNSPVSKTATRTITTGDDGGSDDSEGSLLSSSSSSSSSDIVSSLPTGFLPPRPWQRTNLGLRPSRSTDRSNLSTTGQGVFKSVYNVSTNVVSIRSFDDLLPPTAGLAADYKIFGSATDVCEHNATVARRHGSEDTFHAWHLIKLILTNSVPLEIDREASNRRSIITVARSTFERLRQKDSGVDLSCDAIPGFSDVKRHARIRWGRSPFGGKYLVQSLLRHFEQAGDVQMLAMITCVLAEPKADDSGLNSLPSSSDNLALSVKAPAFSINYHPSHDVARVIFNEPTLSSAAPGQQTTPALISEKGSENWPLASASGSDPSNTQRVGNTPPPLLVRSSSDRSRSIRASVDFRDFGQEVMEKGSVISLSTSPDGHRQYQESSVGQPFSLSRTSLSALTSSHSGSPPLYESQSPSTGNTKTPSPAESGIQERSVVQNSRDRRHGGARQSSSSQNVQESRLINLLPPSSFTSSKSNAVRDSRAAASSRSTAKTSLKTTQQGRPGPQQAKRKVRIKTALHNQRKFDLDGYASTPLLDPQLEWKWKAFRANYVYLLGALQFYSQAAEILKFDELPSYFVAGPESAGAEPLTSADGPAFNGIIRRQTLSNYSKGETIGKRGLELQQRCQRCGELLTTVEKNGMPIGLPYCPTAECQSAVKKPSKRGRCVICEKIISGLMVPCLQCGHLTCLTCAKGWFGGTEQVAVTAQEDLEDDDPPYTTDNTCPTGCGCSCALLDKIDVPPPPETDIILPTPQSTSPIEARSDQSFKSDRFTSQHGPDPANGAYDALARIKSGSTAKDSLMRTRSIGESGAAGAADEMVHDAGPGRELDHRAETNYLPLSRGLSGGLSRGLRNKASEVPTRK